MSIVVSQPAQGSRITATRRLVNHGPRQPWMSRVVVSRYDEPMLPLAITVGDPAGVGPEISAKALRDMSAAERAGIVVVGNLKTMERAAALAGGGLAFAPRLGPHRDGVVG